MTWRIAFNAYHGKAGVRILDREVQAEGATVVCIARLPFLTAEEFFYRVAEAVAFDRTSICSMPQDGRCAAPAMIWRERRPRSVNSCLSPASMSSSERSLGRPPHVYCALARKRA